MVKDCEGRELKVGDRVVCWYPKHGSDRLLGGVLQSISKTGHQVVVLTDDLGKSGWRSFEIKCNKPNTKMAKIDNCPKCELPWVAGHVCAPDGSLGVSSGEILGNTRCVNCGAPERTKDGDMCRKCQDSANAALQACY